MSIPPKHLAVILRSCFTLAERHHTRLVGLLAKHLKLSEFRDWQLQAVNTLLNGKDALVVQPTGSGKSICYQLPPFVTSKMTIVVTPTIALMIDQVAKAEEKGIQCTFLGTGQKDLSVTTKVADGAYELVYVTPERLFATNGSLQSPFHQLARQQKVGLVALDEAHLIASWKTFR